MNYLEKLRYLEYYAYRINKQKGCPRPVSNRAVICGVVSKSQRKAASIMQRAGATPVRSGKSGPYEWELNGNVGYGLMLLTLADVDYINVILMLCLT